MPPAKTITISLPAAMGEEIAQAAAEEHRTVSELLREAFRQYQAQRRLYKMAREVRALVKEKGLTPEDFGGPFEE